MGYLSASAFADDIANESAAGRPVAEWRGRTSDGLDKKISVFDNNATKVFHSDHNPEAYFQDGYLYEKIYKKADDFKKKPEGQ
jgi:hypothetical protein